MRGGGGVEEGKQSRGDSRAQQVGARGHRSRRKDRAGGGVGSGDRAGWRGEARTGDRAG